MSTLLLIKHSQPEINPEVNAHQWHLSEEGRRRCKWLAKRLDSYRPDRILSSAEPKALETGQILAAELALPLATIPELHEHLRRNEPFGTQAQFEAKAARFFRQPEKRVYGEESADQAHQRFQEAVQEALEQYPHQNLAITAHGTVITLLVARACGLEPFPLWKRLGLPSFIALRLPEWEIETIVEQVTP